MTGLNLKQRCLEQFFNRTNPQQKEAIFNIKGPMLIIAGAGSGKTTVLCNRITNLLLFGNAYLSGKENIYNSDDSTFLNDYADGKIEKNEETTMRLSELISDDRPRPWSILAVTFTNKAASELKERLSKAGTAGSDAGDVWAGTFHSVCIKILRRGIDLIGYKNSFTIYDSDDSLRLVKLVMKELDISDKAFNPKLIQNQISRAKDKLITPEDFSSLIDGRKDIILETTKKVYAEYQLRLKKSNALDFDDIIAKTVELLESAPDVLDRWQNQFRYIMVDEYQDTNLAQYKLISMLAGKHKNLCVVGDEDQSIYRFRGATIENILSFEDEFKAFVVKLEQNYRSTETILNAANSVIKNNMQRKNKTLWSDLGEGEKIEVQTFSDEQSEAMFIGNTILDGIQRGKTFSEHVVLYRANAQSRTVELALNRMSIPYRIIGGTKFYDRKEIKDILAYMSVIENPSDWIRMNRIINVPKRNIGDATQVEIERISSGLGISALEVLERSVEFATLQKKSKPLEQLARIFRELINSAEGRDLPNLVDDIIEQTGYRDMLLKEGEEGENRLQNIKELKSSIINFCEENPEAGLSEFLEQAALIADMDSYEQGEDKTVLMTMHSAKGLEFDTVFIVGAEDNIFPSFRSMADPLDIEEERRLAYVAITRAKRKIYITNAKQRLLFGQTQRNKLSRFIYEISPEYVDMQDHSAPINTGRIKPEKPLGYLQSQGKPLIPKSQDRTDDSFNEGDRVTHKIFGEGTVISATRMGNDILLEIAFDRVGTKKIMSNFAKISKL